MINYMKRIEKNNIKDAGIDVISRIKKIKHIALDLDGTIYNGSTLFPFTIPFLTKMNELGLNYSFLTNNPTKSATDYVSHFSEMGIRSKESDFYTSSQATIDFLHKYHPNYKKLFILGTPSMIKEFENAGFVSTTDNEKDIPDAVLVSFDKTLVYSRLCRAAWWISNNLPYFATNPDKVCPTDEKIVLVDCGSICEALWYATNRRPDLVVGKPDPKMLKGIMDLYNLKEDEVVMIGDRVYTDIAMAYNAHALGVLVLSGETTLEIGSTASPSPDLILDDLADFQALVELAHQKEYNI